MRQALLGIDIGSTNTKVAAFADDGTELAKAVQPTATHHPRPDWAEYDANALWNTICALLGRVRRTLPDEVEPAAIGVTGMAEAGVPLDAAGEVLYPAISWFDRRTAGVLEWWAETVGQQRTAEITGLPSNTAAGILRPLWLRRHEPEIYKRMRRWLNLPDFCAFRLCSTAATDYTLASRMMVLDIGSKRWSTPLLAEIGIGEDLLGECVPSGTHLGGLTADASAATGLPEGLPVCTGGHDHVCAALALGLIHEGDVLDSMGTAEAILVTLNKPKASPEIAAKGIAQGIHAVPDRYYAMSGLYYSGGSVDWVRRILTTVLDTAVDTDEAFRQMLAAAEAVPAASGGVQFLPHLRQANPPVFDPRSRGAFVGLTSDTGPGHLARAVMEGVAYECHRLCECLFDEFSLDARTLAATGGSTRIEPLLKIKAALAGRPIAVPNVDEATCLGAAILGGLGARVYSGVDDACGRIGVTSRTVEPDPDLQHLYRDGYNRVFLRLYEALRDINHAIGNGAERESWD